MATGGIRCAPELKQIVLEASRALALLDAERLEELARACQALNRDPVARSAAALQAHDVTGGMRGLERVLDATRANLTVMKRLRDLRQGAMFDASLAGRIGGPEVGHGYD